MESNGGRWLLDRFRPVDVLVAATLLTRTPIRISTETASARANPAIWAYPLVGAAIGLVGGLAYALLTWTGVAPGVAAVGALAAMIVATGGLHEDGLADTADGLGGGARERALEIMRDSRIGAYGTMALTLALLARWSAVSDLTPWTAVAALIAAGAVSRAAIVVTMWALPPARPDGLSALVGRPDDPAALAALGIAILAAAFAGGAILLAIGAAVLATWGIATLAQRRLGGQTGDVLGAVQQGAEIAVLAVFTMAV